MAKHSVVLIPGDGIGPEITLAMRRVIEAAGADICWEVALAGADQIERWASPLPVATLEAIRCNKVAIKGPVTTPVGKGFRSVNVALRKELGLYACLRPVCRIPSVPSRYRDVDLVIVRENTEDLYAGIECAQGSKQAAHLIEFCKSEGLGDISCDSGISIKPISVSASKKIVRFAFEYALSQGRKKVTAVHKANIMKHSDGLFLHTAREFAESYKGAIDFEDRIVDAFCMDLVIDPSAFDVVVLPNLYGDIASDLAAGLIGGIGLAPGANIGDSCAVFEAVHGSAPDIAGKNQANPTALILSAVMMLDHLGEKQIARRVKAALYAVYEKGEHLTADVCKLKQNGATPASCSEFCDAVIKEIQYL